ncbi:hypothetical protein D3C80_2091880 [compost metagenome]
MNLLVLASMAWTIASMPVAAVIAGGRPRVRSASSSARSGSSSGEITAILAHSPVVITAMGVTSEPVPAVVGT